MKSYSLSKITLIFAYLIIFISAFFFYPKWEKRDQELTISWDVSGYYLYLPSIFIYKDIIEFKFYDSILTKYKPTPNFQQVITDKKSKQLVIKYTSGQAIAMLPFFLIADNYCKFQSYFQRDGYSYPYQKVIGVGMLLYTILGLYYLRKILILYFSELITSITLLSIVIGTNYLNYSSIDHAQTHNVLFAFYTLLIYYSIKFYDLTNYKYAVIIGLIIGFMTLIRPTEIISIILPLFWNVNSFNDLRERILFIIKNINLYITAIIFFSIIISIQFIYWYYVTGNYFVYSYDDQGFSWLSPHIIDFTFSYKCGWLMYTPLMIFGFLGIIPLIKYKINTYAIISFIFINYYILTAWDIWDFGGSSGRAMVQSYVVFAFTIAAFLKWILSNKIQSIIILPLFTLTAYINIWWFVNGKINNVEVSNLTKEYYWHIIGRWKSNVYIDNLLENNDSYIGKPKEYRTVYYEDFENSNSTFIVDYYGKKYFNLNSNSNYLSSQTIYNDGKFKNWVRVLALVNCLDKEWNYWNQAQFTIKLYNSKNELIKTNVTRIQRLMKDKELKEINLDISLVKDWSKIEFYIWNANSQKNILIDNISVITF